MIFVILLFWQSISCFCLFALEKVWARGIRLKEGWGRSAMLLGLSGLGHLVES